jgi:hypothetical protein
LAKKEIKSLLLSIRLIEVIKGIKLQYSTIGAIPSPHEGEGHDCMDAGGRATHGAVAEDEGRVNNKMSYLIIKPLHPNPLPDGERE